MGIFYVSPTRSAWKKAIKKGYVTINGQVATTGRYVSGGEHIQITLPAISGAKKKLIFPLTVLYEDVHLAAIHKPPGIRVSGNRFMTITNALPQNLSHSDQPDAAVPQPVHRLDYATTGVLLVGKTQSSISELNTRFENKQIDKSYIAITIGTMKPEGVITTPVDGKPARTQYTVIDTVPSGRFKQLNLVEVRPETGRRHQIRKHFSEQGNPILGDKDYGQEPLILYGKGMYLHARALRFVHPKTGNALHIQAPVPKSFTKIFQRPVW